MLQFFPRLGRITLFPRWEATAILPALCAFFPPFWLIILNLELRISFDFFSLALGEWHILGRRVAQIYFQNLCGLFCPFSGCFQLVAATGNTKRLHLILTIIATTANTRHTKPTGLEKRVLLLLSSNILRYFPEQ